MVLLVGLLVKRSVLFKPLKICLEFVSLISRDIGINTCLLLSSYNNSYHSSISMAPYEALYGRICRFQLDGLKWVSLHFWFPS